MAEIANPTNPMDPISTDKPPISASTMAEFICLGMGLLAGGVVTVLTNLIQVCSRRRAERNRINAEAQSWVNWQIEHHAQRSSSSSSNIIYPTMAGHQTNRRLSITVII